MSPTQTPLAPAAPPAVNLTAAQAHVLAAQTAAPSYAGHNVGQYIELVGPLDVEALDEAVSRTFDEAPWLRFSVTSEAGRYRQAPAPARTGVRRLPRLDTSGAADPVAAAVDLVRRQLACPPRLELLVDPVRPDAVPDLAGAVLVTAGPRHHLLVQYFHQLVVDGYGVALLSRRIAERYTALVGRTPVTPSPFAPVSVLADAESAYAASAAHATELAAWQERYADLPDPVWPSGRTAPAGDTALRRTVVLGRADGAAVSAAARTAGVTWGEAVVAATAVHLTERTGAKEATLALFATARTAPGTLRVPGMAVNVLPARIPVGPEDTFRTLLGRAAAELTFLRGHQRVRGEELAKALWPALPGTRVPGPLINLRPFETELDFAGTRGHVVTLASGPVDDLSVSAAGLPDGRLRLDFDANPALYDADALARHADACAGALVALAREPGRPLGEVLRRPAAAPSAHRAPDASAVPRAVGAPTGTRPGGPGHDTETGTLPLLPSAHRLREARCAVERLHESVLLRVPAGLRAAPLRQALAALARRHPALRLALHRTEGVWTQEIRPAVSAPAVTDPATLRRIGVAGRPREERDRLVAAAARTAAEALDPRTATVLRAVWFDAGPREEGRLLLLGHELSVDDVTWQALTDELVPLYEEFAYGEAAADARMAPAGGLVDWAARLSAEAQSTDRARELPHWRTLAAAPAGRAWAATEGGHLVTTLLTLPPAPSGPGSRPEPGDGHAVDALLLTALARLANGRPRLHDGTGLLVDLELPRPEAAPRTAGRLTSAHLLRLALDACGPSAPTGPGETYGRVVRELAAVPDRGRGLDQLRHLNPQTAGRLADLPRCGIRYRRRNVLRAAPGSGGWGPAPASEWRALEPTDTPLPLTGPLEVTAYAEAMPDGSTALTLRWRWSDRLFGAAEARELAEEATATVRALSARPSEPEGDARSGDAGS
ncbi:condensation domain-containing protein [Streptomyces sp. NPDC048606]|uniref:condensation domain-containing protein n=1 Tax=Streptomyces sp. NPDC048606 TaxID=3154726 RepID=UPI00343724D6